MSEIDAEFHCPECNSSTFGSSQEGGHTTRHCHGRTYESSCRFTFPVEHDWKYFRVEGRRFSSEKEYDEYMERWRAERTDICGHAV